MSEKVICSSCGDICNPIVIDIGIGAYEYWGARGIDKQLIVVSDCCEDACIDENGEVIEYKGEQI